MPPPANPSIPQRSRGTDLLTVILTDYFQVAAARRLVGSSRWYRFESRLETNTARTLELLDEYDIKATFFVLGWIADEFPDVVREVARRGHEIAGMGYFHRGLGEFSPREFRADVRASRGVLESASGQEIQGFRIAHSWLGPSDLWALDILAEEGFSYDSSIRPQFRTFAREPWRRFPHIHRCGSSELVELPVSTVNLCGLSIPICAGNYLRQCPEGLMRQAVKRWHEESDEPLLMYFHVWELDSDQPRLEASSFLERARHYRNLKRMPAIVRHYLATYRFTSIAGYLGLGDGHRLTEKEVGQEIPERRQPSLKIRAVPREEPRTPVTIVVPCYNEELVLPYLARTLESVERTLEREYELSFVLVDDGSTDGTWEILQSIFGSRADCQLLHLVANRGVAAAILAGIQIAHSEIVCSIDCDCTYDPHQLQELIPRLDEGTDLVTASPYHSQGRVENVPAWRLALSKGLSWIYRRLLPDRLATYTSCFRVYRRSSVVDLRLQEGGFLGVAEMLCLLSLQGARIVECPAVLEVRLLGHSKMRTLSAIAGHLKMLAKLVWMRLAQREHLPKGEKHESAI